MNLYAECFDESGNIPSYQVDVYSAYQRSAINSFIGSKAHTCKLCTEFRRMFYINAIEHDIDNSFRMYIILQQE